jgi:hypothetical protein
MVNVLAQFIITSRPPPPMGELYNSAEETDVGESYRTEDSFKEGGIMTRVYESFSIGRGIIILNLVSLCFPQSRPINTDIVSLLR